MTLVDWADLSLAEGQALTREWEASRGRRLAWLADNLGEAISPDRAGLERVWQWYLSWRADPASAEGEPPVVWMVDEVRLSRFLCKRSVPCGWFLAYR